MSKNTTDSKNTKKKKVFWANLKQGIQEIEDWQKNWEKQVSTKKCPRCDSTDINTVKPSMLTQSQDASLQLITLGIRKPTKPLDVCRSCGFSWEPR